MLLSATQGVEIPSTERSAYCQARSRLPEHLLEKLFSKAEQSLEEKVTTEYLWCGRHVKVIDGSTVSMPDTVENQKAYPQSKSQKPGCGFPIAKIGVVFSRTFTAVERQCLLCDSDSPSLATGAALAIAIEVLNTHDIQLARKLYQFLNPLDVLLGDRAFCAYADLVFLKNLGCDAV